MFFYDRAVFQKARTCLIMALRLVMEFNQSDSKTILCQAVLRAKGGLRDAHFMRYVAFTFNSPVLMFMINVN